MTKLLCCLLAVAACGHAAPAPPTTPTATTTTTPPAEAAPPVQPVAAPAAAPEVAVAVAADAGAAGGKAPSGCRYVNAEGKSGGEPSIISLPGGERGFSMPQICPQQACAAGITIDLPIRGDWKAGVYDVEVATELGTKTCHVTLKDPGRWVRPADCNNERELSARCARPQGPTMGPIMIGGTPAKVHVKIARDGHSLVDHTLTPTYSNKRWDGFDCNPACLSAKAKISVP